MLHSERSSSLPLESYSPQALPSAGVPVMLQSLICSGLHGLSPDTGPVPLGPSLINIVQRAYMESNVTLDALQLVFKDLITSWHGELNTPTCPTVFSQHNGLFFQLDDGYEDQDQLRDTVACTCEVMQLQDLSDNAFAILTDPGFLKVYQGSVSLQAYLAAFQQKHNYDPLSAASYATLAGLSPVIQVMLSQPKAIDLLNAILKSIEPDPLLLMQQIVCPDLPKGSFDNNQPHLNVGNNVASVLTSAFSAWCLQSA